MHKHRRSAAFTLMELLVAASVSSVLGLIIYGVGSEGLLAFEKNISINRSYAEARQSLDRISLAMQSAGHVPVLIDATGATATTTYAAGIRFWRYDADPCYLINTTPALTSTNLTVSLTKPGTLNSHINPPNVGDMITVAALGFQAPVQSVSATATTATLTFSGNIALNTNPTLTVLPTASPISCLDWTPVAFITVGTQLRYYPTFIPGTTSVSNAANYHVITNLIAGAPTLPFSLGPAPTINVDLYAEAPDYNNRNLGSSNTYTYFATAMAPRNPILLRSPY